MNCGGGDTKCMSTAWELPVRPFANDGTHETRAMGSHIRGGCFFFRDVCPPQKLFGATHQGESRSSHTHCAIPFVLAARLALARPNPQVGEAARALQWQCPPDVSTVTKIGAAGL